MDGDKDIVIHNGGGRVEEINSINDIDADNLVHIKRFIFYEDEIHTLGVVVW